MSTRYRMQRTRPRQWPRVPTAEGGATGANVLLTDLGMSESRNLLAYAWTMFMRNGRALGLKSTPPMGFRTYCSSPT